jgi:hypothetical protein
MSDLTDALRASCVPSLYSLVGRQNESIVDWLLSGDYKFDADVVSEKEFALRDSPSRPVRAIGYEFARLSTASFESIAGADPSATLKKATAWLAIRTYYSAYFAAHALMRAFGVMFVKLETPTAERLGKVAAALSKLKVAKLENGYYVGLATTDPSTSEVIIKWRRRDRKGGVHALSWGMFSELLNRLANDIIGRTAAASPDRHVQAKLDALRDALKRGGTDCTWLSDTRNAINYSHPAASWFPFTGIAKSEVDSMFRGAQFWRSDAMLIDISTSGPSDVLAFIRCCTFVVAACRELVEDISELYTGKGNSFVTYGPEALLAQIYPRRTS